MENEVRRLMGDYIFNPKYTWGFTFNAWGNTVRAEEWINEFVKDMFPADENGNRRHFHNNVFLYDINLQEEWGKIEDVSERYWVVWGPMIRELCRALKDSEVGKKLSLLEVCYELFENNNAADLAEIEPENIWNMLKDELKQVGIQIIIIFHKFEKVETVFPKTDPACYDFYIDLYQWSVKSNSSNREKIILISEKRCDEYAPVMPSSLGSAYEPRYIAH